MLQWTRTPSRLDGESPNQGGVFVSVYEEGGKWWVRWWVGPVGVYEAPSEAKAMQWVERFARTRLEALGRAAATPGVGPSSARPHMRPSTPEEQARDAAISARFVPPKRPNRRRR